MTQIKKLVELIEEENYNYYKGLSVGEKPKITLEYIVDHLLEKNVIVPPCKIGDKIWLVFSPKHPANPADKGKWFMIEDGVQRIIFGAKGLSIETWNVGTIPEKEINKKLFFSKEQAEKVLAERKANEE